MDRKIAKNITKAIVDTNHPLLDFRSEEAKEKIRWIEKYLKPYIHQGCRLIDIGCGTGKQSFAFEELDVKVTGVDCSEDAIEYANNIKKEINSNCDFVIGDYTEMPFQDSSFDVAIFPKNIIECSYEEADRLGIEVKRILKKEGIFIITMEDGLKKALMGKSSLDNFYFGEGRYNSVVKLPNNESHLYPTFFWTVPFAKYIFSKKFRFVEEKDVDNEYVALFFQRAELK